MSLVPPLLVPLLLVQLRLVFGSAGTCQAHIRDDISSFQSPADLPGFTRSVYQRDHALITPESQVFSALPGWTNAQAAYLVTPAIGSHFTMYIARMEASSSSAPPLPGVERLVFVLAGSVLLTTHNVMNDDNELSVNSYAYLPPHFNHTLYSTAPVTFLVLERRYFASQALDNQRPQFLVGNVDDRPLLETPGEVFDLRKLLPSDAIYDFNVHIMDFQPGEYLNVKEVHYFQHGLFLLEGRGIYRLSNQWYPVQAGDAIWMAPFVPQWYGALGRTRSRYFLYKDINRDPLLHPYGY
ncbi:(S)-ureidoglycine aminohydrolase-like [Selaginella moellendorffii]|uniref:(S)-ureidoglycine aminohydrolase-like n=1 Tax=Selaginella moellendorffii TaxID=88036 RepID=UPI000D1CDEE9|nr:(S)-ureidoglycine aminohydrolase-like [Selaginella moellendorffii]|eukprot:XP_024518559.1 (S)-ureidoglycine aminohydrolase-like [Selaginella moellendorffii]